MTLSDAIATVKADDERVRITEYRLPPGSHTGWHRHGMAYVVVPTQGGRLRIVSKDGESPAEMPARSNTSVPSRFSALSTS